MSEPTAGTVTPAIQHESGDSLADQKALRAARIRAVAFLATGVIALFWATSTFGVKAAFSFWVQERGGASADIVTTVGVLWALAGVASIVVAILQLVRGATFGWRRGLLVVIAPWIAATLAALLNGKPAIMTNVLAGSLEAATPITMAALGGILSERSGMFNIALEGKMLVGAFVAAVTSSVIFLGTQNTLLATLVGIAAAMLVTGLLGLLLAWLGIRHKVDQIIAGTVINIGAVGITDVVGSSRVDLQACKLEYSIVSPK